MEPIYYHRFRPPHKPETVEESKRFQIDKIKTDENAILTNDVKLLEDENFLRLPQNSMPLNYKLHLKTNIHAEDRNVEGDIDIHVKILEETNRLIMHSRNQEIDSVQLFGVGGETEIPISYFSLYAPADMLTMYLNEVAATDTEFIVRISYSFEMRSASPGYYATSYRASDGTTKYLGTTQFEPVAARYVFPLYDEPLFKAVFDLSITHDQSYHAISNTDGIRSDKLVEEIK